MRIIVTYTTIDHFRERKAFDNLQAAAAYAQRRVGPHPDTSQAFNYAVSDDGIGKIEASIPVADLFPEDL